jgi:spore germination protein GerM
VRRRSLILGGLFIAVLAWAMTREGRRPAKLEGPGGLSLRARTPSARDTTHAATLSVRLYFATPGGDSLAGEMRAIESRPALHERVESLIRELARGPRQGGVSLLPPGTAVRHVYIDHQGLLTLDLTPAFRDFHGGSTAEYLSVGSVVRTLLANLPEARRVRLACGGEPLATLGGHVGCDRPFAAGDLR